MSLRASWSAQAQLCVVAHRHWHLQCAPPARHVCYSASRPGSLADCFAGVLPLIPLHFTQSDSALQSSLFCLCRPTESVSELFMFGWNSQQQQLEKLGAVSLQSHATTEALAAFGTPLQLTSVPHCPTGAHLIVKAPWPQLVCRCAHARHDWLAFWARPSQQQLSLTFLCSNWLQRLVKDWHGLVSYMGVVMTQRVT